MTLAKDSTEATYRDVLAHLPQGQKIIEQAYNTVEKVMKEVADYVGEWLRYQVYNNFFFQTIFFIKIHIFHVLSMF